MNLQALVPADKAVVLTVTGDSALLPPDTAASAALVVNELVTNALEHAFPHRADGRVEISFLSGSLFHTVTVSDNGVGFDAEAAEMQNKKHVGIRNVRERIEKMCGGTLTIDSRIDEGTSVTITIPGGNGAV